MKARHEFESDLDYRLYLRTYFAAMAMSGCLGSAYIDGRSFSYTNIAEESVQYADALIEALNK